MSRKSIAARYSCLQSTLLELWSEERAVSYIVCCFVCTDCLLSTAICFAHDWHKDCELDSRARALKKAKEKKEILNVDVGLILADVHFLPFKKGVFDSCICINVMDHFPDINGFLRQVKHVVRSEGYFVFNFSNLQSPYLPIALVINSRKRAMFRSGKIQVAGLLSETSAICCHGMVLLSKRSKVVLSPRLFLGEIL